MNLSVRPDVLCSRKSKSTQKQTWKAMKNRTKLFKKILTPKPNLIHEFALRPNKELYNKIENIKEMIKKTTHTIMDSLSEWTTPDSQNRYTIN